MCGESGSEFIQDPLVSMLGGQTKNVTQNTGSRELVISQSIVPKIPVNQYDPSGQARPALFDSIV